MTRVPQQIARLTALLIGILATSAALALATVEVTTTGSKQNDTTLQLVDSDGKVYDPDKTNRNRFSDLPEGKYTARVLVGGQPVGEQAIVTLAKGTNRLQVDSSGSLFVLPRSVAEMMTLSEFLASVGPGFKKEGPFFYAVDPLTERPLVRSTGEMYGIALQLLWRLANGVEVNAGGLDGRNRSNSVEVPVGQRAAITFDKPQGDIMGFSGNGGAGVRAETKFSSADLGVTLPAQVFKDEEDSWEKAYWFFRGLYSETKDRGTFNVLADPSIWSTTDMKVKEWDLRAGYELRGAHTFPNRLVGSIGVGAEAIYYHATYDGNQAFVCPICSTAIRMVSVSTSDTKNRLTFGAVGTAGLSYPVSKDVAIFFMSKGEYEFGAPKVVVKNSPINDATHLEKGDRKIASAQLGVAIKF